MMPGNESSEVDETFHKLYMIYNSKQSKNELLGKFYAKKHMQGGSMGQHAVALRELQQTV